VHAVLPEVQEKRLVLVVLNEFDRLVGQPVGDVLAGRPVGDGADVPPGAGDALGGDPVGREIARGARARLGVERDLEALLLRPVGLRQSEVPLADVGRAVAGGAQRLGQRGLRRLQEVLAFGHQERQRRPGALGHQLGIRRLRRLVTCRAGDAVARRVLARQNRGPRRRAERLRVGLREAHALLGQPVHVRRLIVLRAVGPAVHPPHVVDQKEDDVGFGLRGLNRRATERRHHRYPDPRTTHVVPHSGPPYPSLI
jgi:hypothetical protein